MPQNDNYKLQKAIDFLDLESWIVEYAEIKPVDKGELKVKTCPRADCGNTRYKLYVNVNKKTWICHRCNWSGGPSSICELLAELSGRNVNDVALELIKTVVPTPTSDFVEKLRGELDPPKSNKKTTILIDPVIPPGNNNFNSETGKRAYKYALSRGINEIEINTLNLQVAGKLDKISGPFLIFPVTYGNTFVGWQGRRIYDQEPRYVSSDTIKNWIWPIGEAQLAWYRKYKYVAIVEGVIDAIGCWRLNRPAICTFGKAISDTQIKLLKAFGITKVILAWDPGTQKDIENAVGRLRTVFQTWVADLSVAMTPDAIEKIDPGKTLLNPKLGDWLRNKIDNALDTSSSLYYEWCLRYRLGL